MKRRAAQTSSNLSSVKPSCMFFFSFTNIHYNDDPLRYLHSSNLPFHTISNYASRDPVNVRELIAVVHGKGIAFYHVFPVSGTLALLANFQSTCGELEVFGFLEDRYLPRSLP